MKTVFALLLLAIAGAAMAVTDLELKQAFAKAQKKGAVAVYEDRCGGNSTLYFPGGTASNIARTALALSALGAARADHGDDNAGCSADLHEGDTRLLELYPDGTVKAH
jgi:hypothetical protein